MQQREKHFGHVVLTRYLLSSASLVKDCGVLMPIAQRIALLPEKEALARVDEM